MPVIILDEAIRFPNPNFSGKEGLLAIGGDLSPERLLKAYENGIFPWFGDDSPILWWSPDPRMILIPGEFKKSKSLLQTIRRGHFEVRFDENFGNVIRHCAKSARKHEDGTWILPEMISSYTTLHKMGFAHSVETYLEGKLVGGLYGLSIGRAFFGESMFYLERDASKVAFAALVERMMQWEFHFIDAQQQTTHLKSLGALAVPRAKFLKMLREAVKFPSITGKW
jgi:leucyl/phenylalanyl-tRNA--protein transferase